MFKVTLKEIVVDGTRYPIEQCKPDMSGAKVGDRVSFVWYGVDQVDGIVEELTESEHVFHRVTAPPLDVAMDHAIDLLEGKKI